MNARQEIVAKVLGDVCPAVPDCAYPHAVPASLHDTQADRSEMVPTGYKKTNVGMIPEDWRALAIGLIANVIRGASPRPIDSPVWFDSHSKIGWLRISDVTDSGKFLFDTTQNLSAAGIANSRPVKSGSLVMSICATVGRPIITRKDVCIHDGFVVFDNLKADKEYLYYVLLNMEPSWSKHGQTGSQMNLNTGLIRSTSVPLPPLAEQRAISEALSDVDESLAALEALIAKKRAFKQAAIQQLITGKTRLPGFCGAWKTKLLGEIGEISGAGVDKKSNPNDIPVRLVNYLDVYNKTFIYSKDLTHLVSARSDQLRRCMVKKGDVFFTPTSEVRDDIGCSAVAMEDVADGVYSYHVVRLRLRTDWDLRFRAYAFSTEDFFAQASTQCEGSGTRYVITLPKFRAMTVSFPPTVAEQRAISQTLFDIDAEISCLEQRLEKTRAIKHSMMQQLLTGRVRLSTFPNL